MCPPGGRCTVIYLTTEGVLWMCPLGGRCTAIYLTTERHGMDVSSRRQVHCYIYIYIKTEGITKVPFRSLYTEHQGKYSDMVLIENNGVT